MVRAFNSILTDIRSGALPSDTVITEQLISERLDTAGIPDPDLLIRTSGEERLSNYLLWQCAYTEFYFTDVHWPAFTEEELRKALESYSSRQRRFGKTGEQVV